MRLFETFWIAPKGHPFVCIDILQHNGCRKIAEGPPFYIFRHCDTVQKSHFKKFFGIFSCPQRVPPSIFFHFLQPARVSQSPKSPPFSILSLRYGADFGRSRLVWYFAINWMLTSTVHWVEKLTNRLHLAFQMPVKLITESSLKNLYMRLQWWPAVLWECVSNIEPFAQLLKKSISLTCEILQIFIFSSYFSAGGSENTLTQITHPRYSDRLLTGKTKFRFPTFFLRFVIYWLRKKLLSSFEDEITVEVKKPFCIFWHYEAVQIVIFVWHKAFSIYIHQ